MQSSYRSSFEKVSRNTRHGKRKFNQGNPHREKRLNKRQARYD